MANTFNRDFRPVRLETGGAPEFVIPSEWLTWGDFFDVQLNAATQDSTGWNAFFLLVRPDGDLSSRSVNFDAIRAHSLAGGSSTFRIKPEMAEPRIKTAHVPVPFILRRGHNDVLAAIELQEFRDKNLQDAVLLARTYFNILSATFAYLFGLPLMFQALHVARSDNPEEYALRLFMPWAEAQISEFNVEAPSGIATRLMLMYAEGMISNSQVYRFLCFFKVVDHIFRVGGPALRKIHREQFPTAEWLNFDDFLLPDDPIARFDVSVVGLKYRKAYERYRETQLRNAAAHVLETNEAFEPLDPAHAAHYRAAAVIFKFISHHLIQLVSLNAKAMMEQGASGEELLAAFYPRTASRR